MPDDPKLEPAKPDQQPGEPADDWKPTARASILATVVADAGADHALVLEAFRTTADGGQAIAELGGKLPDAVFRRVGLADQLAAWTDDSTEVIGRLMQDPTTESLRSVAWDTDLSTMSDIFESANAAAPDPLSSGDVRARAFAKRLFEAEPTAVLWRLASHGGLPIDKSIAGGVAQVLLANDDFNIRTEPIHTLLSKNGALDPVDPKSRPAVAEQLRVLQRVQAISSEPHIIPALLKSNVTSALTASQMTPQSFAAHTAGTLTPAEAAQVHATATAVTARNQGALVRMQQAVRGSGMALIDGTTNREGRLAFLQEKADEHGVPLNLGDLFGGIDYCDCAECLSVYSPAAYFVELLEYLRANNLTPIGGGAPPSGVAGTYLEKLFRRRPDLGCLELTCENTFTVLPYIDLVNEVMESFTVNLPKYHADTNKPKQVTLETFNVDDETTAELLAQPQHVNYQAYCLLKHEVFPFTLPYHQPIDASRIWLRALGTSRYELLKRYRTATETCPGRNLTNSEKARLRELHEEVQGRATDAEFLGLTQEEYIVLAREAFWPKEYFDLTKNTAMQDADYQDGIRVHPTHEYFGYASEGSMLSADETLKEGITFVGDQLLRRTGVHYADLVAILRTRFVNPNYPVGNALLILESIQASYRQLQALVDTTAADPATKYAKVVRFLVENQTTTSGICRMLTPDPCQPHAPDNHLWLSEHEIKEWVECYFARIGQLIVLESHESARLPFDGDLFLSDGDGGGWVIGHLRRDGQISGVGLHQNVTGHLTMDAYAIDAHGSPVFPQLADGSTNTVYLVGLDGRTLAWVNAAGRLMVSEGQPVEWLPVLDSCDITSVRLVHLDGTSVTVPELDRLHRFIRIWRKLGWSVSETDAALVACSDRPGAGGVAAGDPACEFVGFDEFADDCGDDETGSHTPGTKCPDILPPPDDISAKTIRSLAAIKEVHDQTAIALERLLTFWTPIPTTGTRSLFERLFRTHNLVRVDDVFRSDAQGNYLTGDKKLSDHLAVVLAALRLKAEDVAAIRDFRKLPDSLTISCLSSLYRHSLLARSLHLTMLDLLRTIKLLGDPFASPANALRFMNDLKEIQESGFAVRKLDYVVTSHDDVRRPLGPSQRTILRLSKTIFDGLVAIDAQHRDLPTAPAGAATDELVRAKLALLFESASVERIVGLLDGTANYSTNAPSGLKVAVPADLSARVRYSDNASAVPPTASLQVSGILNNADIATIKALSPSAEWAKAVDRAARQPTRAFDELLLPLFADPSTLKASVLSPDVSESSNGTPPTAPFEPTAPKKHDDLLRAFLPVLRATLAKRMIVDTVAGAASLAAETTNLLLTDVLIAGGQSALESLRALHNATVDPTGWSGYLIAPTSDRYTLVAISDTQPAPITLDGISVPFPHQQDDPSNVWSTDAINLEAGVLRPLKLPGLAIAQMRWRTATSDPSPIAPSALLPDYSSDRASKVFASVYKAAIFIDGFKLKRDEVAHFHSYASDFAGCDFNALTVEHWRRLRAYTKLRDELPRGQTSLLDFFRWSVNTTDTTHLVERIAAATLWHNEDISALISDEHFQLDQTASFRNEIALVRLREAIAISVGTATTPDRLFRWANPTSQFWPAHAIAEDQQAALRSRYIQDDWEQVVKPLYDELRENQKQALISHLLVQQDLVDWGVIDADSLFDFLLIDVQMSSCLKTSRIKQAISTVQTFVQRSLLGLEATRGVPKDALDRARWKWTQKYRVWEANRKVFLYPENWLKAELRDDKSEPFKALEASLLQKDINDATIKEAVKNYAFGVDEVANLRVVGLFVEQDDKRDRAHIFARSRNTPYRLHYRYHDRNENGDWSPWEEVRVDVPTYDTEGANGVGVKENGTYLIPVVWQGRLLLFFPMLSKKTSPRKQSGKSFEKIAKDEKPADHQPNEFWEVKLGWSERRNGKWTQKQISPVPLTGNATGPKAPDVAEFDFVPRLRPDSVAIDVVHAGSTAYGVFKFVGSQVTTTTGTGGLGNVGTTEFQLKPANSPAQLHSFQAEGANSPALAGLNTRPYFEVTADSVEWRDTDEEVPAWHPFAHQLLGRLSKETLDSYYDYFLDPANVIDWGSAYGATGTAAVYHELKSPYALYNWEPGLHILMLLGERLVTARQFDLALQIFHYALDPFATNTAEDPVWRFPPFGSLHPEIDIEDVFLQLQPNAPDSAITDWRDKPFQPHVVARNRPTSYMRWVAMQYVRVWIAYGDYYFRQNTLETLSAALQCYITASHVYGPAGERIPKRGKTLPQTYNSLLGKWDAFGNAIVNLELAFPFSNQVPVEDSTSLLGHPNIFGTASSLYFCVPDNPELRELRKTIDDRLFKIRHCQDINGVFRDLPLFEPPIDPALLVEAAAQGLSIASVLADLDSPMPNYRFPYLLQKALEACAEVKSLGAAVVNAIEKGDNERLAKLRASHDTAINTLVLESRKQQIDEATKSLAALEHSRLAPVNRFQHQLTLIGEDLSRVPTADGDFSALPHQIEPPVSDSGLKLSSFEKQEFEKAEAARDWQTGIGITETIASVLHAIPTLGVYATPFGVGGTGNWGGSNLGSAAQAVARGLQIHANSLTFESTNAGRKGSFQRQLQDRILAANAAGFEIKNIDAQLLTQKIRVSLAEQELTNQQKQIDNAADVEDFYKSKYTNEELYTFMENQTRELYNRAYGFAYELARKAEKAYQFERGQLDRPFIKMGYWDPARDGLVAGERLFEGLKQLEAAYVETRGHDFELAKKVSLRMHNPMALMDLRETGSCEFELPEVVFDMDYPGHYQRRIKSVSVQIPCVVGPYTSLNCTLRLVNNRIRTNSIATSASDYPESTDSADERFMTTRVPIAAVAVSSADLDAGVFELNFHDERYLPFEGAGAISTWRLELPTEFRQFDYGTITDVVMKIHYTSRDGGQKLAGPANGSVTNFVKSVEELGQRQGLFTIFDVVNEFSREWSSGMHPGSGATERVVTLAKLKDKLPFFTASRPVAKVVATDVILYIEGNVPAASITGKQGNTDIAFTEGPPHGAMRTLVAHDVGAPIDSLELHIADLTSTVSQMWLVERYTLV
jgi:Tc toxin complex TcA C-terminal TcB-binding domain/Neuraminidase-like domain